MLVVIGENNGFTYHRVIFHTDAFVHQPVQYMVNSILVEDIFEYFCCVDGAAIWVVRFQPGHHFFIFENLFQLIALFRRKLFRINPFGQDLRIVFDCLEWIQITICYCFIVFVAVCRFALFHAEKVVCGTIDFIAWRCRQA